MKKWIVRVLIALIVIIAILATFVFFRLQDRHPGYEVDLTLNGPPGRLHLGFSKESITPDIQDTWVDENGNSEYESDIDSFIDGNGNGEFDPYWIAGFGKRRAANGVHDSLWARTVAIDDGTNRIAIVTLDAIGFGHDDVIRVRKLLTEETVDYCIVNATHDHESPDLIGLWGENEYVTGVNPEYLDMVINKAAESVVRAVENLRPARLKIARDTESARHLVSDTRKPIVLDHGLRVIQAIDIEEKSTLGTLIFWANHPETLWSKNLMISSDFPHYVREGVEKGVYFGDSLIYEGLGGIAIYMNGAIGGLMTTHPGITVYDPYDSAVSYTEPSFKKAESQGKQLAIITHKILKNSRLELNEGNLKLRAKTFDLPLYNPLFKLAALLGVVERGMTGWMKIRSEVAVWTLGPATFVHVPGEIYPEIINGGIENPPGADFQIEPQEIPPVREMITSDYKFVIGLSNDLLGYIIPKSEWDDEPPYLYDAEESPYGEINSVGPETAPVIHDQIKSLIKELE